MYVYFCFCALFLLKKKWGAFGYSTQFGWKNARILVSLSIVFSCVWCKIMSKIKLVKFWSAHKSAIIVEQSRTKETPRTHKTALDFTKTQMNTEKNKMDAWVDRPNGKIQKNLNAFSMRIWKRLVKKNETIRWKMIRTNCYIRSRGVGGTE